jgi:hypothetical protein
MKEADRILEGAKSLSVTLRFLGGVAIILHCPTYMDVDPNRVPADIDLAGFANQARQIIRLLKNLGHTPDESFNALHGQGRLLFDDADVFLDKFEMCHMIDLRPRLKLDARTIPLADLLITKLQIIDVNQKDATDVWCLIKDHDVGDTEDECINGDYIAGLCSVDWGLHKTLTTNIRKHIQYAKEGKLRDADKDLIIGRLENLQQRIDSAPKSIKWKIRDRIGERRVWYETPQIRPKSQILSTA